MSNCGNMAASLTGYTNAKEKPPVKLRQLRAQAAMDAQVAADLSHGLRVSGQQSSIASADIAVSSCGFNFKPAVPTAGGRATETAISKANMVRAKAMLGSEYPDRTSAGQVTILRGAWPSKAPATVYVTFVPAPPIQEAHV